MSDKTGKNKNILNRVYEEMWNRGDLTVASEIFAEPEGVEKFVKDFRAAFPDLNHTVDEMIAEGDRVVVRFSAHGTHTGQWKQYKATGKPIHYTGVTIAVFEGDKIKHHHTWWDTLEVVEQIRGEQCGD